MSHDPEKRARRAYAMTIVQTVCSIVTTLIAVGALIGNYLKHH